MKQTRNAINMLNAAYRSVFKHAFMAGLATCVVAVGAANAQSMTGGGKR